MPQTLTGTDQTNISTTVGAPSGGDARNSASVATPMQTLIDNDVTLKANHDRLGTVGQTFSNPWHFEDLSVSGGTARLQYVPDRAVKVTQVAPPMADPAVFLPDSDGRMTDQGNSGSVLVQRLYVPHGSLLTGFRVYIDPAAHANLPANKPTASLKYITRATGAVTTLHTETDASGSAGAYQVHHLIEETGLSHLVDSEARQYYLVFTSESGSDSAAGLKWVSCELEVTMSEQPYV